MSFTRRDGELVEDEVTTIFRELYRDIVIAPFS